MSRSLIIKLIAQQVQIGKWHIGTPESTLNTPESTHNCPEQDTPEDMGFNVSLGVLGSNEDHKFWVYPTYCEEVKDICNQTLEDSGNASDSYSSLLFGQMAVDEVNQHNATQPLFMYISPTQTHGPYTLPSVNAEANYLSTHMTANVSGNVTRQRFATFNAMVTLIDDLTARVESALVTKHMWKDTLLVYASDNGGMTCYSGTNLGWATNYPLRGGKKTVLEGGIRTVAFMSGGFVPQDARGTTRNGYVHIADWYTTLAKLAGAEFPEHDELGPYTHKDGVPNVDGVNVWWYLVGENETSPRTELVFKEWGEKKKREALIQGDMKLVLTFKGIPSYSTIESGGGVRAPGTRSVLGLSSSVRTTPQL